MKRILVLAAVLFCAAAHAEGPAPRAPGTPYAATGLPDRVVLSPGADPAREMAVAWRTDPRQTKARAEIAPALDGPAVGAGARAVDGTSAAIETENGGANYHQVRFSGLAPDTAYVYRVMGAAGWSEWLQFRTAAAEARPFRFLYFGDVQNGILQYGARVIRQAVLSTANPAVVLFAGDLVAQRDDMTHDDEWGEWNASGGFAFASIPVIPAAGNHEYVDVPRADGGEDKALGPHWPLQFALPANGVASLGETTYYVDYQGVRFIVLDGTSVQEHGTLETQAQWLTHVLGTTDARWTIVLMHQPVYTCARPNDTPHIKEAWVPLFERYGVDLVLQGHDHCYSRVSGADGAAASAARAKAGEPQGPVYIVSVTGKKMYGLNDRAGTQPDRVAEETQLYQVIDVEADRLRFAAYTATGRLYDGFELVRAADGRNRLLATPNLPAPRVCNGDAGPDGPSCLADPKD